MIGVKGMQGPDSGIVDITLDGELLENRDNFTVYNHRYFYAGEPLAEMEDREHTVTWTLSSQSPDKGAILASYYKEGDDKDFREHPEEYETNRFSVGRIIIVGDVLK
jgi:hypothetical protein